MTIKQFIDSKVIPFAKGTFPVSFKVVLGDKIVHKAYFYSGIEISENVFEKMIKGEDSIINITYKKKTEKHYKSKDWKEIDEVYNFNLN